MIKCNRIIVITMMTIIFLIQLGCNSYSKITNTDLSNENISGIYLTTIYNHEAVEKRFGKVTKTVERKKSKGYEFATEKSIVFLEVDKNNEIINVSIDLVDNSIKTNKGITNSSTFKDVVKVYGENYLRKDYSDFMGSGDGYTITYVDKNNKYKLQFDFYKGIGKEQLTNIIFNKY